MYSLVKFVEDGIYHICKKTSIKIDKNQTVKAKWRDGRFYEAVVISKNANYSHLKNIKLNFEHNFPTVVLSKIDSLNHLNKKSTCEGEILQEEGFDNSKKALIVSEIHTSSSLPINVDHNFELNTKSVKDAVLIPSTEENDIAFKKNCPPDVNIEINDGATFTENYFISDFDTWIELQCDTATSIISEMVANNAEVDQVPCHIGVDHNTLNLNNLQDEEIIVDIPCDDSVNINLKTSEICTKRKSGCNQFQVIRKNRRVSKPYHRQYVLTPSMIEHAPHGNSSNVVFSSIDKKTRRYFCMYCKKLFAKFPQHLQISHRDEPAVQMFMSLPPKNYERKKIIETIRRRGDFIHNTSKDYNSGHLLVARRSNPEFSRCGTHYLPCPYCAAFFKRETLHLHTKNCVPVENKGSRSIRVMSRAILSDIHPRASEVLKLKIFPILRDHECVNIIRYDILTILFGNYLCSKYSSLHHHDMIRNKLRSIGRLLIAARHLDSTLKDFANLLTPSKFDVCVAAIKSVGGINEGGTSYKAPTTVLTLSTVCKQASQVWKTECIKINDKIGKKHVDDFMTLFKVTFPAELANTAVENRVQQQRQKVIELPSRDDIQKLVTFLRRSRREWFLKVRQETSNLQYAVQQLASYTLVSLMVFNRRRPGELERITIKDFSVLKSGSSNLSFQLNDPEEIRLAEKYKRFEIRGKLNRTVPVLVEFETEACINLIIEKRQEAGIPSENPYIFACLSTDNRHKYLRAYFLLRNYAKQCGASRPDLLRANQLRKQIATECALKDLADNEIHDVASFMGHAIDIHNNIYRRPVAKRDIVRMSKILETIQGDNLELSEDEEPPLNNIMKESYRENSLMTDDAPVNLITTESYQNISEPNNELSYFQSDTNVNDEEITLKNKKGKHKQGLNRICGLKTPWSINEKTAVIKHFTKYLNENKLPTTKQLLEKLPTIKALKDRSPTSVKTWIHNELKRRNAGEKVKLKARWTPEMKRELKIVFREHFEDRTLPSNAECAIAIDNCRDFEHLTVAALKTAVANEQKRTNKHKINLKKFF